MGRRGGAPPQAGEGPHQPVLIELYTTNYRIIHYKPVPKQLRKRGFPLG